MDETPVLRTDRSFLKRMCIEETSTVYNERLGKEKRNGCHYSSASSNLRRGSSAPASTCEEEKQITTLLAQFTDMPESLLQNNVLEGREIYLSQQQQRITFDSDMVREPQTVALLLRRDKRGEAGQV